MPTIATAGAWVRASSSAAAALPTSAITSKPGEADRKLRNAVRTLASPSAIRTRTAPAPSSPVIGDLPWTGCALSFKSTWGEVRRRGLFDAVRSRHLSRVAGVFAPSQTGDKAFPDGPQRRLGPRRQPELGQHVADVRARGACANHQSARDVRVRFALRDEYQDLAFPRCERRRAAPRRDQRLSQL